MKHKISESSADTRLRWPRLLTPQRPGPHLAGGVVPLQDSRVPGAAPHLRAACLSIPLPSPSGDSASPLYPAVRTQRRQSVQAPRGGAHRSTPTAANCLRAHAGAGGWTTRQRTPGRVRDRARGGDARSLIPRELRARRA